MHESLSLCIPPLLASAQGLVRAIPLHFHCHKPSPAWFGSWFAAIAIGVSRRLAFLLQKYLDGWRFVSLTMDFWWWSYFWVSVRSFHLERFISYDPTCHCYFLILFIMTPRNSHQNPLESRDFDPLLVLAPVPGCVIYLVFRWTGNKITTWQTRCTPWTVRKIAE